MKKIAFGIALCLEASPTATVGQAIGVTDVQISYHAPRPTSGRSGAGSCRSTTSGALPLPTDYKPSELGAMRTSMKRLFTLVFLFIAVALSADPIYRTMRSVPQPEATVWIDGKLEPIFFEPAAQGRYSVSVTYEGLSQSTPRPLRVVHGDETTEIRDWALQRQIAHATTWEESKRLLLARIENNPRNAAAWFTLAAGAEQHEDYETTKGYYEKAMAVTREIGGPDADDTVRGVERIMELLPAYFADREHLVIVRENFGPGNPKVIELRERKSAPRVDRRK